MTLATIVHLSHGLLRNDVTKNFCFAIQDTSIALVSVSFNRETFMVHLVLREDFFLSTAYSKSTGETELPQFRSSFYQSPLRELSILLPKSITRRM